MTWIQNGSGGRLEGLTVHQLVLLTVHLTHLSFMHSLHSPSEKYKNYYRKNARLLLIVSESFVLLDSGRTRLRPICRKVERPVQSCITCFTDQFI